MSKGPNERLAYWVSRAQRSGASYARIAAKIKQVARSKGIHDIATSRSRVWYWVNRGEHPQAPIPALLAEALGQLCDPPVSLSPSDIGLSAGHDAGPAGEWAPHPVADALRATTQDDLVTASPPTPALLTGDALLAYARQWLELPDRRWPDPVEAGRLGMSDVHHLQDVTTAFRNLDAQHGGGASRAAVIGQLHDASRLARHAVMSERVGRELMATLADLASVAGWMTHDAGYHEAAQGYMLLGLQAAAQAGPAGAGIAAHLLNCLARQANHLRCPADALELVQAAQYGLRRRPTDRVNAVLAALAARCHAALGDIGRMERALEDAEHALAQAQQPGPVYAEWFDAAEHGATVGACHFLAAGHDASHAGRAVSILARVAEQRPSERARSRAFDAILLSRALLLAGETGAAGQTAQQAVTLLGAVTSTRVRDRLAELYQALAAVPSRELDPAREAVLTALTDAERDRAHQPPTP